LVCGLDFVALKYYELAMVSGLPTAFKLYKISVRELSKLDTAMLIKPQEPVSQHVMIAQLQSYEMNKSNEI
jgi:hypothetical protein